MRTSRVVAAFAVGGMVTFGSMSVAGAADLLRFGRYHPDTRLDVILLDNAIAELVNVDVNNDGEQIVVVQVGGETADHVHDDVHTLVPLTVCALCAIPEGEAS